MLPVLPPPFPTIDYFNGVKRHLEARPDVEAVFAPSVDAVGSIETRSVQLARRIAAVPGPVHIIAHSMGGLDARRAIAAHPVETARTPRHLFDTWPFDHAGEVGWSLELLSMPHLQWYDKIVDELLRRTQ